MDKAFLVIDYTYDFVAEDGHLTCGLPGINLEQYMVDTTIEFLEDGQFVVMPNDMHEENDPFHPETALFPPHNIRGTNLDILLRARGIREVHLLGVCTDICILHTAIDAYNLGYDIFIHERGVASFDMEAHQFALKHFKHVLNATIVS